MDVIVTGAAGFIGYHVARRLLDRGDRVVGLDVLDPYYSVALKRARLQRLRGERFTFVEGDIVDESVVRRAFEHPVDAVLHFAAQVGVRHSAHHPEAHVRTNIVGFGQVIEAARRAGVRHFLFASSSSVYGGSGNLPFRESQAAESPLSVYAATKKADELLAYSYSHLFGLPTTAVRFFTVYGPWGRPDMAVFMFTQSILAGEPLRLFGAGRMTRDFTYIDDAARAVVDLLGHPPRAEPGVSAVPSRVVNVGTGEATDLLRLVGVLERAIGRPAVLEPCPSPAGDLLATQADRQALDGIIGARAWTPVEVGVTRFVEWYLGEHGPHAGAAGPLTAGASLAGAV